ncbi:hypothetical protein [Chondromyces apiculatus]|uniref:Uncharacterized protein n=1 Tax=Chondromyces apiculatus DSM 436 TaxID=1192034 RepID=A0A017STC9_9BACT|nr:hypothetical protein [Chondromyces apiculatus]EYF00253.1 Hypothetical protein CAP_1038 [Chondromyces apiculatus DSM 436]
MKHMKKILKLQTLSACNDASAGGESHSLLSVLLCRDIPGAGASER